MVFFVLNLHESHERHERKTRQNNEAIAEVGDATQQGFLPTPLTMLPRLVLILRRVDSENNEDLRPRKEDEILANHPDHPHPCLVCMSLIYTRNFLCAFGFLSKIRIV